MLNVTSDWVEPSSLHILWGSAEDQQQVWEAAPKWDHSFQGGPTAHLPQEGNRRLCQDLLGVWALVATNTELGYHEQKAIQCILTVSPSCAVKHHSSHQTQGQCLTEW